MTYELPESIELHGQIFPIVSDFRAILIILEILNDKAFTKTERAWNALSLFYQDWESIPQELRSEACEKMYWFIRGGEPERQTPGPKPVLMSWKKDFPLIIGPVNKVLGEEARAAKHLHWWTFLGAYMSLGDCLFNQIVAIRKKKAEHKKLEKWEKDFEKQNPELVALDGRPQYTAAEEAFFDKFAR